MCGICGIVLVLGMCGIVFVERMCGIVLVERTASALELPLKPLHSSYH